MCDPLWHTVCNARDDHSARTVSHQNRIADVLEFEDVRDVLDVGSKPDLSISQMCALAEPGERWCEHLVPSPTQDRRDFFPTPTPEPRGMNENKGRHRGLLDLCAREVRHDAAAPPSSVMNFRRRIAAPEAQD